MRIKSSTWSLLFAALMLAGCGSETSESLTAAGKQSEAKKDYVAAVVQYKAALQLTPNSPELRLLVGSSLLQAGDPASAVVELTKALDQKVAPEKVLPLLSKALVLSGEFRKLTSQYNDVALDDKTAQAELKANLAKAWGAQRDKARTESSVAASLAAVPGYGPAEVLNASLTAGRGEFDKALSMVDAVLKRDPTLYEAWMLRGEIFLARDKDRKSAEAAFRKVLEIERAYLPAHAALVSGSLVAGDLKAASEQADQLRKVLPSHPQTMFVDALIAYSKGDLPKAKEQLQQLLRVLPDHTMVLQLAGVVEAQTGGTTLAENYFSKALTINPNLELARLNLARIYAAVDQPVKTLETLKPLLADDRTNSEAQAIAGEALLRMGDLVGAEARFSRATQFNPTDVRSSTSAALARLSRGETGSSFEELTSLSKKYPDTYPDLAIVTARLKRSEYREALQALDVMAKKAPDNAQTIELRGRVLVAAKDYAGARAAFEQALKLDPKFFAATSNLVKLDLLERQPERARKRLDAIIAADPQNYYARMLFAEVRGRSGADLNELKTILSDAVKSSPGAAEPRLQLIDLLLRKRQSKEALTAAEEALAAFPENPNVLDIVGRAYMEAGSPERAISAFRKLANAAPNVAGPYNRLAVLYKNTGKPEMAEGAWKKALELEPSSRPAQRGWIEHLVSSRRSDEALKFIRDLQKHSPDSSDFYALEAEVQLRSKAPDAAVAALRRGLSTTTTRSDLPRLLFLTYMKSGRSADAEKFAGEWLKSHPEDASLEAEVGAAAMARGDLERAEIHLRHATTTQPNNSQALNNLAWVLVLRGKPGAVEFAQRAVDLTPNQPALMDTLALALMADKRPAEALRLQKRAVDLSPGDNDLRLNLAKIAVQAGDKALARTELERLRALGTAFKEQDKVSELMKAI